MYHLFTELLLNKFLTLQNLFEHIEIFFMGDENVHNLSILLLLLLFTIKHFHFYLFVCLFEQS